MPTLCQLIQGIENTAAQADKTCLSNAQLLCNGICGLEAYPPDVIRQAIGIVFYDINAVAAVGLKDFGCMCRADFMALQGKA